ncbi:MAG: tetratricopeptide repeat protein [Candidatus Rokubacteria bacterium]|nr:tetratricopeptide repeat protein [Candidatus Rokubacteria bacterium]
MMDIRRAEERVQREPGSLAFAQLADLYRKAGRTREAIAVCRDGLARVPHYATARLILAKSLVAEGELDAAASETDAIVAANANDVPARRLAAEIERRRGRVDAAAAHLEVVVAADGNDRESRALLGLLRASPGADEASGLARVLRDDTFVTPSFGAVCLEQGATEEAAVVFTRLLRRDPNHAAARDGLEQALRARLRRKG